VVLVTVDLDDVVVVEAIGLGSLGVASMFCGFAGEDCNVRCRIGAGCIARDGRCGR
jgi:hypothetical protein